MSIPIIAGPIGYDSWYVRLYRELLQLLGNPKKFELGWVASEKKLVIHTDRVDDAILTEVAAIAATLVPAGVDIVQYNHNMEISWRDINKYAECEVIQYSNYTRIRDDLYDVNPNYRADLTSDGEWVYPLPNLKTIITQDWGTGFTNIPALKKWNVPLPKLTTAKQAFMGSYFTEWTVGFPEIVNGNYAQVFNANRLLTRFSGSLDKLVYGGQFFWGNTKLTDFSSDLPKLWDASRMFDATILNKKSILHIVNTIPSYNSGTHNLGLGIHSDLQNDPEVLAAISDAEVKGWTPEVRWNRWA